MSDLLTVREAAEMLNVHPNTIKRYSDKGLLPFVRVSTRGDRRIAVDSIRAMVAYLTKGA